MILKACLMLKWPPKTTTTNILMSNNSSIASDQVHEFIVAHSHINKRPFYMHFIVEISQSDFVHGGWTLHWKLK
jgi:7,8-dihydro-6-hydroxymethylpterin-pyrophosphokinase